MIHPESVNYPQASCIMRRLILVPGACFCCNCDNIYFHQFWAFNYFLIILFSATVEFRIRCMPEQACCPFLSSSGDEHARNSWWVSNRRPAEQPSVLSFQPDKDWPALSWLFVPNCLEAFAVTKHHHYVQSPSISSRQQFFLLEIKKRRAGRKRLFGLFLLNM